MKLTSPPAYSSIKCRREDEYLELTKVLGHLALLIHLDHQVKVALGILRRCWRVWPDYKLLAAILLFTPYRSSEHQDQPYYSIVASTDE